MKKIYSFVLLLLLSFTGFSQGIIKPKQHFRLPGDPFTHNPSNVYGVSGGGGSRAIIFSEDFEAATVPGLPTGWSTYHENPDGVGDAAPLSDLFMTGDATAANSAGFFPVPAHTIFAFSNDDNCNCDKSSDFLQMPVLNLTGTTNYVLKFAYVSDDEYGGIATVEASVDGTTWTSIATLPQTSGTYQWQNGSVILSAYTGQSTVYIRFKYNDNGSWDTGLTIDDVIVEDAPSTEVKLVDGIITPNQYPILPLSQVQPYSFAGIITNLGGTAFTGANVSVNVNSGIYTANANSGTLNPGDTATVTIPGTFTPTTTGAYTAAYNVTLTGDADLTNNIDTVRFTVSDSVMARERGTNLFFLNMDTTLHAQRFDVYNTDTLSTVTFFLYKPKVGDTVYVSIHNLVAGVPTTQLSQTVKYVTTAADTGATGALKTLRLLSCGPLILTPGSYAMVFHNRAQYSAGMLISTAFYNPGTSIYSQNNGATWNDIATIAPSAYVMRANFGRSTSTALVATNTTTNVSCNNGNNGSINVTATGGSTSYTYVWSGGQTTEDISNLTAGTYTVTVTDAAGCTATTTATVTQPSAVSGTTTFTNPICPATATGTATVTASGGTSPYTYMWSNGDTGTMADSLMAGTYTVTITDASACTGTANATLTDPASMNLSTSSTPAACGASDGTATVVASGGTAPYTYSWSNGDTTATADTLAAGTYTVNVTDANNCNTTDIISVVNTGGPTVIISNVDSITCVGAANGTATATATGGATPYSYSWNTTPVQTTATASNLGVGTHIVTVTDNTGCIGSASVTLNNPPAITVTTTPTNVSCNGGNDGMAMASATGGTGALTYAWSNGDTGTMADSLSQGTYTVTVTDANSCTKTATAAITQPAALTVSTTTTQSACAASTGSATATVTGGTTPYNYSWSPTGGTAATANGLAAGTYAVTVTDNNGCTATATATVTNTGAPTVTIAPASATICAGSSVTLTASGATTYSWNTTPVQTTAAITVSPTATTTYTVTGTTAGCTGTASATVTVNPLPATPTITVSGDGVVLTSSAASGNMWNLNGTSIGATGTSYTATANGSYTVTVTDANSCSATSAAVNVTTVGITEVKNVSSVSVYPNPASTQATLAYELSASSNVSLKVFDVTGKEVVNVAEGNKAAGKHLININTENLNSGVYYYSLTVNGNSITKKLVIVK